MSAQSLLQQAVNAAKIQDWDAAVTHNQGLLDLNENDIGALNRIGVAYSQLQKLDEAREVFERVLAVDKSNAIAKKNLYKLDNHQTPTIPHFSTQDFIEEPGKTRTVELHRLAGKNVLESLAIGQECQLKSKNRYISIETKDNVYVGALPEDISFRLAKLVESGNTYYACIRSFSNSHVSIYIKELDRSAENQYVNSFPTVKTSGAAINDVDDSLLLDDDLPVEATDAGEAELEKGGLEDLDNDNSEV